MRRWQGEEKSGEMMKGLEGRNKVLWMWGTNWKSAGNMWFRKGNWAFKKAKGGQLYTWGDWHDLDQLATVSRCLKHETPPSPPASSCEFVLYPSHHPPHPDVSLSHRLIRHRWAKYSRLFLRVPLNSIKSWNLRIETKKAVSALCDVSLIKLNHETKRKKQKTKMCQLFLLSL